MRHIPSPTPQGRAWILVLVLAAALAGPLPIRGAATPDSPDPAFNPGENIASGLLNAVAAQADGKVIVAGRFSAWGGEARTNLVRLNGDGSLDGTFASLHWDTAELFDVVVDAQDRLYVCGQWKAVNGATLPPVIRLTAGGAVDATFPSDARWLNNGKRLTLLADGSLLYNGNAAFLNGGSVESHAFLRLRPDGTADTAFSKRFAEAGFIRSGAFLLAELPGGPVQILGDPYKGGVNVRGVRLLTDGTPDPAWSTAGTPSGLMTDAAVQADGSILVSGSFSGVKEALLRLTPDGKVDPAFNAPFSHQNQSLVRLDRDGGIYFRDASDFWKLGADGATNQNFKVDFDNGGPLDLSFDARGRILLVGTFQGGASRPDASVKFPHKRVIRLLGRAALDPVDPPTPTMPQTYADLANRVFLRTAPNGAETALRLLPANTFEPSPGYRTNRADYSRAGLPADQGLLVLAGTDTFGNVYAWQTNRFLLTFATPTNGTYELDFTISTVPGVQKSAGPFTLSRANNILPRITQQPTGGAYVAGQNISALAVGTLGFDLGFQWYRNGVAVPGATKNSHPFVPMGTDHVGDWLVVVTNALGAVTSQVATVTLASVPVVTLAPQSVSVLEGGMATFAVTATGGSLNYQWLFNGGSTAHPNAPAITVSNLTPQLAGLYSVRISNNAGSVVSAPARLRVCSAGLDATWQGRPWVRILRSGDLVPGSASRFGPLASPSTPLFTLYDQVLHATVRSDDEVADAALTRNALVRWRAGQLVTLVHTNTPLPGGGGYFTYPFYPTDEGDGAVNFQQGAMYEHRGGTIIPILTPETPVPGRPDAKFGPSGSFARRGAGVAISTTLDMGLVTGNPTGLFFHDGAGLRRLADDTTDLPGVLTGYAYRLTEDAVNFDGATVVFSTMAAISGPGGVFRCTTDGVITKLLDSGDLIPGLTNAVVSFGDVDVEGGAVFAVVGLRVSTSVQNRIVKFEADGTAQAIAFGDFLVAAGPRQVYFGSAGSIQRWTDGVVEPVVNTQALFECQRVRSFFDVEAQGDDVAIGVEFQDGTAGIYANFGSAAAGAVRILAGPRPVHAPETAPAVFSVAASGPGPLSYQWFKNGVAVPGATGAVLTLRSVQAADVAEYHVVVTAAGDAVTSPAAGLTLAPAPASPLIYVAPANQAVPVGSPASFQVVAAGQPPLTYRWTRNGQTVAEGPAAELVFPAVAPVDHGAYTLVVSNAQGSTAPVVASLSVLPRITRQPESQTVPVGGTATFSVAASGFEDLRYLWFKGTTVLAGRTNATLTLENVQVGDAAAYSVSVSGVGGGNVRSLAATLTVGGGGGGSTGVALGTPVYAGGKLSFTFPTTAGQTYEVQFRAALGAEAWAVLQTLVGDGTPVGVEVPAPGASGFVRIATVP